MMNSPTYAPLNASIPANGNSGNCSTTPYTTGGKCSLACNDGLVLTGSSDYFCNSGFWLAVCCLPLPRMQMALCVASSMGPLCTICNKEAGELICSTTTPQLPFQQSYVAPACVPTCAAVTCSDFTTTYNGMPVAMQTRLGVAATTTCNLASNSTEDSCVQRCCAPRM